MPMKTISLKLEKLFLEEIEKTMKKHNYATKTEFIREAIRDKVSELGGKQAAKAKEQAKKEEIEKPQQRPIPSYI